MSSRIRGARVALIVAALVAPLATSIPQAAAASGSWTGLAGASWFEPANWTDGVPNGPADVATIGSSPQTSIAVGGDVALSTLRFTAGGYTVNALTRSIQAATVEDDAPHDAPDNTVVAQDGIGTGTTLTATVTGVGHRLVLGAAAPSVATLIKRGGGTLVVPASGLPNTVQVREGPIAFRHAGPFAETFSLLGGSLRTASDLVTVTTTISGPVPVGANGSGLGADDGKVLDVVGALTGSSTLIVSGPGAVRLGHASGYTGVLTLASGRLLLGSPTIGGDVTVAGGTLSLLADNQLPVGRTLTVRTGGVATAGTTTQTLGPVVLDGGRLSASAPGKLVLAGTITSGASGGGVLEGPLELGADRTFDVADDVASATDLTIPTGSTITAASPSTTVTKAGAGTLALDGTTALPVVVTGGTLTGRGMLGTLRMAAGELNPGTSPGVLQVAGLTLEPASTLRVEATGTTAGSEHDQVVSTGPVAISGAVLAFAPTFTTTTGQFFRIIDNQAPGAVTGTFAGLADDATFVVGERLYRIRYTGGDGNDVVVTDVGEAPSGAGEPVTRLAGDDRVATAIAVSKDSFAAPRSASAVVLSRSDDFADALAGTPLAVAKGGPLLLTARGALDPSVKAEIQRVLPPGGDVYLLGGAVALATEVGNELTTAGFTVTRVAGDDRYATAVRIAERGLGNPTNLLVATGHNFPDALAGGAAAARIGGAVLLTAGRELPPVTAQYLEARSGTARFALGGPAAAAVPSATALVGADRYETATKVAERFVNGPTAVGVASGERFPDALAGGAHAARRGAPIILVERGGVPAPVATYLASVKTTVGRAWLYGGPAAVTESTAAAVQSAIT